MRAWWDVSRREDKDMKQTYTRSGDWGGFSVHPAAKGWVVSHWSYVSGTRTHDKVLIPYSVKFPRNEVDLEELYNEIATWGDVIAHAAADGDGRVLRSGYIVA